MDSFDQMEQEDEDEISSEQHVEDSAEVSDVPTQHVTKSTRTPKARKHKKPDEVELRILKALETEKPCSKMAFLQSLMPHLQKFDDEEFLQFQMGVLNVIGNINEKKKLHTHAYPNPHNFSHQTFHTYPTPQFDDPSTTAQSQSHQFFNAACHPPIYREQLHAKMNAQTSTYAKISVPKQSRLSQIRNMQAPILQETSANKQPSPVSF